MQLIGLFSTWIAPSGRFGGCLNCGLCDYGINMIVNLWLPVMGREQRSLFPTEARESLCRGYKTMLISGRNRVLRKKGISIAFAIHSLDPTRVGVSVRLETAPTRYARISIALVVSCSPYRLEGLQREIKQIMRKFSELESRCWWAVPTLRLV